MSYYTLYLLIDVYDIQSLAENNKHYMNEYVLDYMMPNVHRLFLNITIQHVHHHFSMAYVQHFLIFELDIDEIFNEINAYQFITKNNMPTKCEKCWIFWRGLHYSVWFGNIIQNI